MLILSRRVGESISIGDDITVKVLDIKGGQARIGFEAPKDVTILRSEAKDKNPKPDTIENRAWSARSAS